MALLPSVKPTVEQVVQDPGVTALYERMGADQRFTPEGSTAARLAAEAETQQRASEAAVQTGAESAAAKLRPDMTEQYGLSGTAPRQMASIEARKIFDDLEADADRNVKTLWENPKLENATMYKAKSSDAIREYIDGLSPSERLQIPKEITGALDAIATHPSRDIPLDWIQKLRSQVLGVGREAFRSGNNNKGGVNNALGAKIAEIINDDKNIVFGDKTGAARDAWKAAVDATRDYHGTYNTGWLKGLNREIDSGIPKISLDSTFESMFSGKNATQNLDQMRAATKNAIDPHVSDYLIAELTKDGSKIVSPKEVDAWLAKGNNAAIADKIPGLRDRIDNIRQASVSQQLSENMARNASDPEKLVRMFDDNRSLLKMAIPASERAYFDALEASAKKLQAIPADEFANLSVLDKLAKGNVADLLYGVASGRIAKGVAGIAAAKGAGWAFPDVGIGPLIEAAAGILGPSQPQISKLLDKLMTGGVRDRAIELLQKAKTDPALFEKLMGAPDPRVIADMFLPSVTRGSILGAEEGAENRAGRATGGAVKHAESRADSLVKDVDQVRKMLGAKTEEILNKPDEVVVAALKVANRHT